MTTRTKQRICFGVLIALLLWPMAHFALARRYHINHWRFAGFAMYTRPAYVPKLQFAGMIGDQPLTPALLQQALGESTRRIDGFLAARRLWGELESPAPIGRLILARIPELAELTILVITIGLEPGDDHLSYSVERWQCTRGPGSDRPGCARR